MSSSSCLTGGGQLDSYTRDVSPGAGEQSGSLANLLPGVPVPISSPATSAHDVYYFCSSGQELLPEEPDCSQPVPFQPHQEDDSGSNTYLAPMTIGQSNCLETAATNPWNDASLIGQESGYISLKYGSPNSEIQIGPFPLLTPTSSTIWSSPDIPSHQTANQAPEGSLESIRSSTPMSLGSNSLVNTDILGSSFRAGMPDQLDYSATSDIINTGYLSVSPTPMLRTTSSTPLPTSIAPNNSSRLGTHDTDETAMKTLAGGSSLSSCGGDASPAETPYAQLIYKALMSREDRCMSLQEIYRWFEDHTNKPEGRGKGWQNSIRHNLSMNQGFVKYDQKESTNPSHSPYTSASTRKNDKQKRCTVWTLQDWAIKNGIQSTTRYRDARRRGEARHRSTASQSRQASSHSVNRDGRQNSGNAFGTSRMSLLGNGFQGHFQPPVRPSQTSHFNPRPTPIGEPSTPRSHSRTFYPDPYFSQHNMGAHTGIPQNQQPTTEIGGQSCGMLIPPPSMIQRQLSNSPPSGIPYQVQNTSERNSSMFLNSEFRAPFPYRASDVQLGYTPARNKNSQPRSPGGFGAAQYPDGLYNWSDNH